MKALIPAGVSDFMQFVESDLLSHQAKSKEFVVDGRRECFRQLGPFCSYIVPCGALQLCQIVRTCSSLVGTSGQRGSRSLCRCQEQNRTNYLVKQKFVKTKFRSSTAASRARKHEQKRVGCLCENGRTNDRYLLVETGNRSSLRLCDSRPVEPAADTLRQFLGCPSANGRDPFERV